MSLLIKTIPMLPLSNNERERSHWRVLAREKDNWTLMLPEAHGLDRQSKHDLPRCVEVVFRKKFGPMSDDDAVPARCKSILDALVRRGWLFDDGPKFCHLVAREERGDKCTVISVSVVEQMEDAA